VLLFFSAMTLFAPLASTSQFLLPTSFIVSQHGFNPGLINYSLPEAFSVETIAPKNKTAL